MDLIINFLENQVVKKTLLNFYVSWKLKRLILNIIWGLLNVFILIAGTNLMMQMHLEMVWLAAVIVYISIYWIISSLLFDTLIGDEIDNVLKKK